MPWELHSDDEEEEDGTKFESMEEALEEWEKGSEERDKRLREQTNRYESFAGHLRIMRILCDAAERKAEKVSCRPGCYGAKQKFEETLDEMCSCDFKSDNEEDDDDNKNNDNLCGLCGKQTLLKCGKCLTTYYCSKDHQKEDWINHKKKCSRIKPIIETEKKDEEEDEDINVVVEKVDLDEDRVTDSGEIDASGNKIHVYSFALSPQGSESQKDKIAKLHKPFKKK